LLDMYFAKMAYAKNSYFKHEYNTTELA
jgi:hypothetical protein